MIKPSLSMLSSNRHKNHSRFQGCVAYYALVEKGGVYLYNYARPGVYVGSLTASSLDPTWSIGKYGSALTFDGVDDVATLSNSTDLDFPNQKFSISLIYKATVAGYLIARRLNTTAGGGLNGGYFLRIDAGGTLTARLVDDGNLSAANRTSVGTQYLDGNYHSVTVVYTTDTVTLANNDVTIYADGILDQGSRTDSGANPYKALASYTVLGTTSDFGAGTFLTGTIEEVRIYNRELSYGEAISYFINPYLEFEPPHKFHNDLSSNPVATISSRRLLVGVGV